MKTNKDYSVACFMVGGFFGGAFFASAYEYIMGSLEATALSSVALFTFAFMSLITGRYLWDQ